MISGCVQIPLRVYVLIDEAEDSEDALKQARQIVHDRLDSVVDWEEFDGTRVQDGDLETRFDQD